MTKKYIYFVSYDFATKHNKNNYGRCEIYTNKKIKKMDQIRKIENKMKKIEYAYSLIVNNFILLREEECE